MSYNSSIKKLPAIQDNFCMLFQLGIFTVTNALKIYIKFDMKNLICIEQNNLLARN